MKQTGRVNIHIPAKTEGKKKENVILLQELIDLAKKKLTT